jgi:uncharacterized protein YbjT (DUF2867 family)
VYPTRSLIVLYYLAVSTISSDSGGSRRVVVFGASGGVGRHLVQQALSRGYDVVAVVRSPGKLTVHNAKVTVVTRQLSDRGAIDAAVRDADGVISGLGPSLDRRATGMPLALGTRNIATFLLDQLGDTRFIRAALAISN